MANITKNQTSQNIARLKISITVLCLEKQCAGKEDQISKSITQAIKNQAPPEQIIRYVADMARDNYPVMCRLISKHLTDKILAL